MLMTLSRLTTQTASHASEWDSLASLHLLVEHVIPPAIARLNGAHHESVQCSPAPLVLVLEYWPPA